MMWHSAGWWRWSVIALCVMGACVAPEANAQQQSFSYQGQLRDGGVAAEGRYDLRFRLFEADVGGDQVGTTACADDVSVVGGRFVVVIDFGAIFDGRERYLEIEVRPDTGLTCGDDRGFEALAPRQLLTAAPWAHFASSAGTASSASDALSLGGNPPSFYRNAANLSTGVLADSRLPSNVARLNAAATFTGVVSMTNPSNVFAGEGTNLTNLNAANITQGSLIGQALAGTYFNAVNFTNTNNTFAGNGGLLTFLNASNFSQGTLPPIRGGTGTQVASATIGQVLKWNGAAFTPQNENTFFAGPGLTLTGNTFSIQAGQVTGAMIATNTITNADIAFNTIGNANMAPNSITSTELAFDAGSLSRVTNGTMTVLNGRVAIGGATNTNQLRVIGTAEVTSALQAGSITIDAVDRTYVVQPADFNLTLSADFANFIEGFSSIVAPLHLPDGAIIRSMTASMSFGDPDDVEEGNVSMLRVSMGASSTSLVFGAVTASGIVSSGRVVVTQSNLNQLVDNDNFIYRLEWDGETNGITPEARLHWVKIVYSVTRPLP